jgi:hypothetical protein
MSEGPGETPGRRGPGGEREGACSVGSLGRFGAILEQAFSSAAFRSLGLLAFIAVTTFVATVLADMLRMSGRPVPG